MLGYLGLGSLAVALVGAMWLAIGGTLRAVALRRDQPSTVDLRVPAVMTLAGAIGSMAVLQAALLFDDFSLAYVAGNHARATPFPFNVATAWSALEGSIVLWGLVLAAFTWLVWNDHRRRGDALSAGAVAVMGLVGVFFFGLMLTVANPFEICVEAAANRCLAASPWPWDTIQAPADGPGPNPLLQNHLLMAVHPPRLRHLRSGAHPPRARVVAADPTLDPGRLELSHARDPVRWVVGL